MISSALKMSYTEKQERAEFKRRTLLGFLASGEQWTTLSVAAELLDTTERTALRLLKTLVKEHLLKVDEGIVPDSNLKLYGITDHGISTVGAENSGKAFAIGRTKPGYVQHHIIGQRIRIRMERAGWTDFIPGKLLYVEPSKKLKKIPDMIARRPDGRQCAIEIERFTKSPKRQSDIFAAHLQSIVNGQWDVVYYFVPSKKAQVSCFGRVQFITMDNKKIKLSETHLSRFKIFEFDGYKGEM